MKKKIMGIFICALMILLVLNPIANSKQISSTNKTDVKDTEIPEYLKKRNLENAKGNLLTSGLDADVLGYPSEQNPTTSYGFEFYEKEWDSDREYWRYRFRFDWYQTKFTNGVKDDDSYIYLGVTSTIEEQGIVQGSGNTFDYGAWNVEIKKPANLNPVATFLCAAVLDFIPYAGLAYSTGEALASALDEPEKSSQGPQWETPADEGRFIWEADGFFQYDCYIRPNTDYDLKFKLDVYGSCHSAGDTSYKIGWHFWGTSPGDGPPELQLTPSEWNFGDVREGEKSSEKKFILKNVGGQRAENVQRKTHGAFSEFSYEGLTFSESFAPGDEEEIFIRFSPHSTGSKSATLEFTGDNCNSVSVSLSGNGKPRSRERLVDNDIFLRWLIEKSRLLESLSTLLRFKG